MFIYLYTHVTPPHIYTHEPVEIIKADSEIMTARLRGSISVGCVEVITTCSSVAFNDAPVSVAISKSPLPCGPTSGVASSPEMLEANESTSVCSSVTSSVPMLPPDTSTGRSCPREFEPQAWYASCMSPAFLKTEAS